MIGVTVKSSTLCKILRILTFLFQKVYNNDIGDYGQYEWVKSSNRFMLLVTVVRTPAMHWKKIKPTFIHKHLLFVLQFSCGHV